MNEIKKDITNLLQATKVNEKKQKSKFKSFHLLR
jgi:hypothetical protein